MKKVILLLLTAALLLALTACGTEDGYDIKIVIPAGSEEAFVYSEEEISPKGRKLTLTAGEGLSDTEVVLKPVEVREENAYEPAYLTPGMPVTMDAEKGAWFKVGVAVQNPGTEDLTVYVHVSPADVCIACS